MRRAATAAVAAGAVVTLRAMSTHSVAKILAGAVAVGSSVTLMSFVSLAVQPAAPRV